MKNTHHSALFHSHFTKIHEPTPPQWTRFTDFSNIQTIKWVFSPRPNRHKKFGLAKIKHLVITSLLPDR